MLSFGVMRASATSSRSGESKNSSLIKSCITDPDANKWGSIYAGNKDVWDSSFQSIVAIYNKWFNIHSGADSTESASTYTSFNKLDIVTVLFSDELYHKFQQK